MCLWCFQDCGGGFDLLWLESPRKLMSIVSVSHMWKGFVIMICKMDVCNDVWPTCAIELCEML